MLLQRPGEQVGDGYLPVVGTALASLLPALKVFARCLLVERKPPCPRCGRRGLTLPDDRLLDAVTVPNHLDLFRLEDFSTVVVCTERFVEACRLLSLDGVNVHHLPMK